MNRIKLIALLGILSMGKVSFAAQAFQLHLKMTDVTDSMAYLVHYYGKATPLFITDSAKLDKNGNALFKSTDPDFVGGIYMIMLQDKKTHFEVLMNRGDDIMVTATAGKLPKGLKFKNSPENDRFQEYITFLNEYSDAQAKLKKQYEEARTKRDTDDVRSKSTAQVKRLNEYRRDYEKKYPGTLLATLFKAMETPEIPEGPHYLADGTTKDSSFAYHYYKSHFWDGFNFRDDRLVYTPIYDSKLEEYISKEVLPWPDSVEHEADILLKKTKGTKDMFHYTLWYLTQYAENSKVMGMDEAFVYLVENYFMKGDAFWLKEDELQKYTDRARKIAPNVIGNVAPELKLPNVTTKKMESLHDSKAKYTLLVFYSPNCGHCQHEIPKLDSLYKAVLKNKGVKIFTVATEAEDTAINSFIKKYNMTEWTNTWDHEHTSDYHNQYDVYSTPTIYLLDNKKIIRGKRLDHSNIANLVQMLDNKSKDKDKTEGTD